MSPLGTIHVSDPFKALGQALDHAIRLTTRVQDLPALSHIISQIFSLFLAIVHWANTPKTLALPLPSLCVLLSNIRQITQKMKIFCDILTRQDTAQSKLQHSRPRYQPTLQPLPPPPSSVSISSHPTSLSVPTTPLNSSSSSTLNSSSSSVLPSPYPPQQFRQHKHLIQQLLTLHFHLLVLSGRISDKIETECRSLVSKFTTAAPADIFAVPKKSTQVSANSEKSSGAIFVASSRSKSNLASSLTSLSLPSVPPNEFIAPTSVTQKMVDKILDPALATLLQCEQGTRYGVVSSFLRIVLIGLESVAKKAPPRSLTFPNAVQIAADVDYIRNWAIQAEETFQSLKEKNREQEKRENSSPKEFEEDEKDEEDGKYGSFNSGNSSARKGSFSGYRISNMQSINESFSANNKTGTKNTNANSNISLSPVPEIQSTPFSNSKDFERWEKIIEILTSCTNSERVVTREDIENSIIPDASQWVALCKR